ncbi:MAG: hypothetical protein ABI456_16005 [Ktedonobacteraceae bacterium]|nr:hypothetical protein [Chloroflexota bacterium]
MAINRSTSSPCPNCGADAANRQRFKTVSNVANGGSLVIQLGVEKKLLSTSFISATASCLVCLQCGYVQLFVDPDEVKKKLEQANHEGGHL